MRRFRTVVFSTLAGLLALAQCGCMMFNCSGGGPLKREELGDYAGIPPQPAPDAAHLKVLVADLKTVESNTFAGRFSIDGDSSALWFSKGLFFEIPFTPVQGLTVKGRLNPWHRLLPCSLHGDWLYFHPFKKDRREFYASEDDWGALIMSSKRADVYDVASGAWVGSWRADDFIGLGLGWTRVRQVMPVDDYDEPGLSAVVPAKVSLSSVRYDVRDGNIVLLGIYGWGRVNRTRYIQILWIPIPVGTAAP